MSVSASGGELQADDLIVEPLRGVPKMGGGYGPPFSGVRITHKPTGLVAEWDEERSQLKNRDRALRILTDRVREASTDDHTWVNTTIATVRQHKGVSEWWVSAANGLADEVERLGVAIVLQNRALARIRAMATHIRGPGGVLLLPEAEMIIREVDILAGRLDDRVPPGQF